MHEFEFRKHTQALRGRLEDLQKSIAKAVEDLGALEAAMAGTASGRTLNLEKAVADVDGMRNEQRQKIDDARDRGQGAGLFRALDTAKDLDRQQATLLEEARCRPGIEAVKDTLRRYDELERRQMALLSDEIGKFAAQGLEGLFERYRELSQQQQKILAEILGGNPEASGVKVR